MEIQETNNNISVPRKICREIKKMGTEAAAGVSGMAIDGFGGGYVSAKHLGRRLAGTYVNLLNYSDSLSILKPFKAIFPPIVGITKVIGTAICGFIGGALESVNDIVNGESLKESINNRFHDVKKFDNEIADIHGIYNE